MYAIAAAYQEHRRSFDACMEEIRIWNDFISEEERQHLLAWGLRMRPHLKANHAHRQFRQTDALPELPQLYTEVRLRLERLLGLGGAEREPLFGWYLSLIDQGGAVHSHLDPTRPGRRHLRCNLFLQVPGSGGMPIVEGRVQQVRNGDLLAFFPSERRHCSETVEDGRVRAICSFGYLTPVRYRLPSAGATVPATQRVLVSDC